MSYFIVNAPRFYSVGEEETSTKEEFCKDQAQDEESTLFGSEKEEVLKRHWGNNKTCCFWRGEPIFTLGSDSKFTTWFDKLKHF